MSTEHTPSVTSNFDADLHPEVSNLNDNGASLMSTPPFPEGKTDVIADETNGSLITLLDLVEIPPPKPQSQDAPSLQLVRVPFFYLNIPFTNGLRSHLVPQGLARSWRNKVVRGISQDMHKQLIEAAGLKVSIST